jgi:hypothetical protein
MDRCISASVLCQKQPALTMGSRVLVACDKGRYHALADMALEQPFPKRNRLGRAKAITIREDAFRPVNSEGVSVYLKIAMFPGMVGAEVANEISGESRGSHDIVETGTGLARLSNMGVQRFIHLFICSYRSSYASRVCRARRRQPPEMFTKEWPPSPTADQRSQELAVLPAAPDYSR